MIHLSESNNQVRLTCNLFGRLVEITTTLEYISNCIYSGIVLNVYGQYKVHLTNKSTHNVPQLIQLNKYMKYMKCTNSTQCRLSILTIMLETGRVKLATLYISIFGHSSYTHYCSLRLITLSDPKSEFFFLFFFL